jgi:hypothetical protein
MHAARYVEARSGSKEFVLILAITLDPSRKPIWRLQMDTRSPSWILLILKTASGESALCPPGMHDSFF